ncbi:MAG: DUF1330 domain-containing protein [Endozoicomonas sp.]
MSAYILVRFNPTNTEYLSQYGASVPTTLAQFQGEILAKGPAQPLHGPADFQRQVVIAFPSRALAEGWYNSSDYQALIPLRDKGMDAQFTLLG